MVEVCQALGIEPELEHVSQLAAERFGAYARVVVRHLEGVFFAYRPSFTAPSRLMRTVFRFTWSDAQECLVFDEHSRFIKGRKTVDYSQSGCVFVNPLGAIHLLTTERGAVRLITLAKGTGAEPLRGAVLTQSEPFFQPSIAPVVLVKLTENDPAQSLAMVGPIDASAEEYAEIRAELDEAQRTVVKLALAAPDQALSLVDVARVDALAPSSDARITPH